MLRLQGWIIRTMEATYDGFAGAYDALGQHLFSYRALQFLRTRPWWETIRPDAALLDVACGTGEVVRRWCDRRGVAVGVDNSHGMLARARTKLFADDMPACLVQADMACLPFSRPSFDLITCFFNSINHLPSTSALGSALRGLAAVLRPRGILCFDINTFHHYQTVWHDRSWTRVSFPAAATFAGEYDSSNGNATLRVTGTTDRGLPFETIVVEHAFCSEQLEASIASAGLRCVEVVSIFDAAPLSSGTSRVLYVCTASEYGS